MIFFLTVFCYLSAETPTIPEKFYVEEKFFSMTTTFEIRTKDEKLGTVHRKLFNLTPKYLLHDNAGNRVASAEMRFFNFLPCFDIHGADGTYYGKVHEKISFFYPTFKLYSPTGKTLAKAELNFWGTTWTIKDPETKDRIAKLHRPYFRFLNDWDVTIYDTEAFKRKNIHPHMFYTIMAFQVDSEYWKKREEHSSKCISNKLDIFTNAELDFDSLKNTFEVTEPSDEDYIYSERLAEQIELKYTDIDDETERCSCIVLETVNELNSNQHSSGQKKALIEMLQRAVNVNASCYQVR